MSTQLRLSDATIESMLVRRAARAESGDLAWVALEAVRRAPVRSPRRWDGLLTPRLDAGIARWVWIGVAAMLVLALLGGLLAGATRLLQHHAYPILTGNPGIGRLSRAVSGDELWTIAPDDSAVIGGLGERAMPTGDAPMRLWHFVDGAWQQPISLPWADGTNAAGLALGPDGAVWVSGASNLAGTESEVAVLRNGHWQVAWIDPANGPLGALDVTPRGTVWVAEGAQLTGLVPTATGYDVRTLTCPRNITRIVAATDGTVYVGGFWYAGGEGLARSDGETCVLVDPIGDGKVREVWDFAPGPAGSLLAEVFEEGAGCCRIWDVVLRDGQWSTLSGPSAESSVGGGLAMAPDGHPWLIDHGGLVRYEAGRWRPVAAPANAYSLVLAPDGVLWFATDRGIERLWTDDVGD